MFGNTRFLGDARQDNEEEDGRDFVDGVGADEGPSAPTMVQQMAQSVQDATGFPIATQMVGVSPYVIYAGVAMLGWYVYTNYFAHE